MCGPALPILAAGLAVAGQGISTIGAMHHAAYQRQVAQRQAELARNEAGEADAATRRALTGQYRAMAAEEGRQRVAAAAGGVGVDFGTAAEAVASTRLAGTAQAQGMAADGARAVRQADAGAAFALGRASAAGAQGQAALMSGLVDMGQSVLTGARQYGALRARIG